MKSNKKVIKIERLEKRSKTWKKLKMQSKKDLRFNLDNIFVADFETTTSLNFKDFSKVYLSGFQPLGKFDEKIPLFYNLHDFIDGLCSLQNEVLTVYFHNGSCFDIQFILNYVIKDLNYSNAFTRNLKNKQFFLFEDEKRIYELSFFYKGKLLTFRDSLLLIGGSIKSWGDVFGMPKLELEYDTTFNPNNIYDDKVLDYFKRDITILNRALFGFFQYYQNLKPLSISGQMYRRFENVIKKYSLELPIVDFYKFQRYYFGGMVTFKTQFQNQFIHKKNSIFVYDINSSYPSVQAQDLPYTYPYKKPPKGKYCCFYKIWIEKADIKNENWPPILRKSDGCQKDNSTDYVKHQIKFYLYVVDCEWQWIQKFYHLTYKIEETTYFGLHPIFKYFIDELYQHRLELKRQKNRPAELYVKTGLNSCYGRFAMKPNLPKTIYLNKNEKMKLLPKMVKKYDILKRNQNSNIGDKECFLYRPLYKTIEHCKCAYIPIACYITAKARCKLLEAIWNNIDNFLYCDTDSVFLTSEAKGLELHPTKLGAWKCEAIGDSICYLQAKQYRILKDGKIIKTAHAGLRKQAIDKITNENYKIPITIENGKLARLKVDGGILLVEVPVKLGENNFIFLNKEKIKDNTIASGNSNQLEEINKLENTHE